MYSSKNVMKNFMQKDLSKAPDFVNRAARENVDAHHRFAKNSLVSLLP